MKSTAAQEENKIGINKNGQDRNKSLEREVTGWSNLFIYSFAYIMLEMWKQVVTYGMKYFNDNKYPLPQTQIIAITELLKLVIFAGIVIRNGEINRVTFSLWYVIPSVIYAINNNIFYFALYYATPPLWSVLIQLRIPFTALVYRFIFHKVLTPLQWFALLLLITSIGLSNLTGGQTLSGDNNLLVAILLAIAGSVSSVIGTVVMEYLFKNDERSFGEMQMQLYLFGTMTTWILYLVETKNSNISQLPNVSLLPESRSLVFLLLGLAILLSCSSGIAVASIVKKLDNIVKLYTQALANMATSVACTLFFPDHFHINFYFVVCLMIMFVAIFLFERKTLTWSEITESFADLKSNTRKILMTILLLVIIVACVFVSDRHLFVQLGNKTSNGNHGNGAMSM